MDIYKLVNEIEGEDYEFIEVEPDLSKEIRNGLITKTHSNGNKEYFGLNGTTGYGIGNVEVSKDIEHGYIELAKEVGERLVKKLYEMDLSERNEVVVAREDHEKYFIQGMKINEKNDTYISESLADALNFKKGDEIKVYLRH